MKSVRISKYKRDRLTAKLLKYRFCDKEDLIGAIRKEAAQLAQDIYEEVLGQDMLKQMESIPEGWLPTAEYLQVKFPGDSWFVWLYLNGQWVEQYLEIPYMFRNIVGWHAKEVCKLMPNSMLHSCFAKFDAKSKFASRFTDIVNRAQDLGKQISEASSAIQAAINAAKTTAQLLESWPEIEPFLLEEFGEEKMATAIAIPTEKLNKILELPKELAA